MRKLDISLLVLDLDRVFESPVLEGFTPGHLQLFLTEVASEVVFIDVICDSNLAKVSVTCC